MDTVPELGTKVRLSRSGKVYIVVDVNVDRQTVELLSTTGAQFLIPEVPFARIQEIVGEPPDNL